MTVGFRSGFLAKATRWPVARLGRADKRTEQVPARSRRHCRSRGPSCLIGMQLRSAPGALASLSLAVYSRFDSGLLTNWRNRLWTQGSPATTESCTAANPHRGTLTTTCPTLRHGLRPHSNKETSDKFALIVLVGIT
jgi:hypothetical protein